MLVAGRYRVIALLGRGGMGEVYRADDLSLGQQVALKFLPQASTDEFTLERFRNEVRIARRISHPNVCRVYDIGQADNQIFLSMEYVDGEDLVVVAAPHRPPAIGQSGRNRAQDLRRSGSGARQRCSASRL